MSGRSHPLIEIPVRSRQSRFPMTALADAMFQLLIFFMLASSLTPYSLLPLQAGPAKSQETGTSAATDPNLVSNSNDSSDAIVWSLGARTVTIQAQPFGFDRLDALVGGLGTPTAPADVIIVVTEDASVQDLTTVLEALRLGDVESVRIAAQGD